MNIEMERRAIECLKAFEPHDEQGYYLCYSGGKDGDTVRLLAQLAGVAHQCKHNLTTADAPETVYYIRDTIGKENIISPALSIWQLIVKKGIPPSRKVRYCCSELKEIGGKGQVKITGVRKSESKSRRALQELVTISGAPKHTVKAAEGLSVSYRISRKNGILLDNTNDGSRRLVADRYKSCSVAINPIIDWEENDVWQFLHHYGCKSNPLYQCGFKRIGCVGCPLGGFKNMKREFEYYPKFYENYIKTFDRMIAERARRGQETSKVWADGEAVMRWWLGGELLNLPVEIAHNLAV